MHAALGEPVRLAIAEALAVGDLSGKELAATFDLPTNLLAHHLGVMESAGLITRRRSEGDGRRSYVHLRTEEPSVANLIAPADHRHQAPPSECCSCAHTTRLAHNWLPPNGSGPARSRWPAPGPIRPTTIHRRALDTARRHKLSLAMPAPSRWLRSVPTDDLVVAVCDQAHEELAATGQPGAIHWSIPDPVRHRHQQGVRDRLRRHQGQSRPPGRCLALIHRLDSRSTQ